MSQHDMILDNANGASFRADLNAALQALASTNAGSSPPTTTYAYQIWMDTTNNQLKQRNAANSGWDVRLDLGKWSVSSGNISVDGAFAATGTISKTNSAATVQQFLNVTGSTTAGTYGSIASTNAQLLFGVEGTVANTVFSGSAANASVIYAKGGTSLQLGGNGAVQVTLNGTSLAVTGSASSTVGFRSIKDGSDSVDSGPTMSWANAAQNRVWICQLNASNGLDWHYFNGGSFVKQMTFDASGNLGLGVTPSAWNSSWRAVDLQGGSIVCPNSTALEFAQNAYFDASAWKYKSTASAGWYYINGNSHVWSIAPLAPAGSAITWTQAMTLDANGRLLIGKSASGGTTPGHELSAAGTYLSTTAAGTDNVVIYQKTTTAGDVLASYYSDVSSVNSLKLRFYATGNVQNANNSYGAISDPTKKFNITLANSQMDDVELLAQNAVNYNLLSDPDGHRQLGFISRDNEGILGVRSISPGLVQENIERDEDGKEIGRYDSVAYSVAYMKALIATGELVTKCKGHEARIAAQAEEIAELRSTLSDVLKRLAVLEQA